MRASSRLEETARCWTTPRIWCRNIQRLRRDMIKDLMASWHPSLRKGKCKNFTKSYREDYFGVCHPCEFIDTNRRIQWIRPRRRDRRCTKKAQWIISHRHIVTRHLLRNLDINPWRTASRSSRLSNLEPVVGSLSRHR